MGVGVVGRPEDVVVAPVGTDVLRAHHVFPPAVERLPAVRDFVRVTCRGWRLPVRDREVATLVAYELVANAMAHAGTACELTLEHDRRWLRVRVRDGSSAPPRRRTDADHVGLYGLDIVAELAVDWSSTPHDDGKTVWACLPASTGPNYADLRSRRARGRPPAPGSG